MKTRTRSDVVQLLSSVYLHPEIASTPVVKSLQSAALVLADHPNAESYKQFQKCLWKMHGYMECKVEAQIWIPATESKIRMHLCELENFFA